MSKNNFQVKPLEFEEAIKFFQDKVPMTRTEYDKLIDQARHKAFTVGNVTQLDILQDILDELRQALEQGRTLEDFQKSINKRLEDKGWQGKTPHRLDTVFRTNIQTAYQVGRYQQMRSPEVVEARPYWMYDAVRDEATRPSHRAMHGFIRRYDDPIWDIWYPPNGFCCRCKVIALSKEAAKRRGLKIQESSGEITQMKPDSGFDRNAGKDVWEPDLGKYDPELKKLYKEKN